jgi:hypothetical protein
MTNLTTFLTVLGVLAASILGGKGDTCSCQCCAGNSCTPILQGTITVQSCATSSCLSLCKSKYPQQCVDGSGSARYQCTVGTVATANWIGTFSMSNTCDQRTCCCPVGKMVVSSASTNLLRVQCSFAGSACPSGVLSLDDTIAMPDGYSAQIVFLGNRVLVELSPDSRTIQLTNPVFPSCSETASRSEAPATANWIGTFSMSNACDQRTCCCPVGKMVVSSASTNLLRVQCSFAGSVCPSGVLSLDDTIAMPDGYSAQIVFLGNRVLVELSPDSRTIQLTNPVFPSCSETAVKSEALSSAKINMALMSLLFGFMSLTQLLFGGNIDVFQCFVVNN